MTLLLVQQQIPENRVRFKSVFAKILEFEDQMHVAPSLPPFTALKAVYIIDGMAIRIQILKSAAA